MAVAYGAGDPAQTVIMSGADVGILPFRVCGFYIYGHAEYIAVPPQLSAVTVGVQEQVALLVIPEALCIALLVGTLTDFTEAVVTVLHGTAVAARDPAALPGRGVFITFFYAVRKADTGNASPAVHFIEYRITVSVHNPCYLPSGIVFLLQADSGILRHCFMVSDIGIPVPVFHFPSPRRHMALTFPSGP